MSEPAVTVAMSVYNGGRFLADAIESILAQSFGDFEFLILDDGSSDSSLAIAESYARRDERIRVLSQANRGLVASLNQLISEACAPLIARMDADDLALPTRFERQVAFLAAHPDHGVVGCRVIDIDEAGLERGAPDHPADDAAFRAALENDPLLCHPTVMMRTELVRSVGGYRPAFRHCEDYDLWLRLSERTRLCSIPDRLLKYRHSPDQVSSRHIVEQLVGARIAWLAHRERIGGRRDPTEGLDRLPGLDGVDALFGREGVARDIRAWVAPRLLYSAEALKGQGFELLLHYACDQGSDPALWRTSLRLLRLGEPRRAARLAAALARAA